MYAVQLVHSIPRMFMKSTSTHLKRYVYVNMKRALTNALPKVLGFFRMLLFRPTGKIERLGYLIRCLVHRDVLFLWLIEARIVTVNIVILAYLLPLKVKIFTF